MRRILLPMKTDELGLFVRFSEEEILPSRL
jgi:hypothetical protein